MHGNQGGLSCSGNTWSSAFHTGSPVKARFQIQIQIQIQNGGRRAHLTLTVCTHDNMDSLYIKRLAQNATVKCLKISCIQTHQMSGNCLCVCAQCRVSSCPHSVKYLLVFFPLFCRTLCLCHFCLKEVLDEMVCTETLSCFCVLDHHISKTIYMS